mgnify:CR=1 FL=1
MLNSCTKMLNSCAKMLNSCVKMHNSCTKIPNLCAKMLNSCVKMLKSGSPIFSIFLRVTNTKQNVRMFFCLCFILPKMRKQSTLKTQKKNFLCKDLFCFQQLTSCPHCGGMGGQRLQYSEPWCFLFFQRYDDALRRRVRNHNIFTTTRRRRNKFKEK